VSDLAGVYDALIGGEDCDPFDDSASAVAAHEDGDWVPLLLHNLADIERTREVLYAQALKETGVNFLIRAHSGTKSKKMWEAAEDGVNVERAVMSRSRTPYESVEITRFVVPARERMNYEYVAFITNREVTRRQARRLGKRYPLRWAIETSYRVTNTFLPKTASKHFALRQFYRGTRRMPRGLTSGLNPTLRETNH
jgi:hypothetical protein